MNKVLNKKLAQKIGTILNENKELLAQKKIETEFGDLEYIREPKINEDQPLEYINKKALFWLDDKYVLCHYWGEDYIEDPTYFRRLYEKSVDIFMDSNIPTPNLVSYHDESMTWIIEKMDDDLSKYLDSKDNKEIENIIDKVINLFSKTWELTKSDHMTFPKYVRTFIKPEYDFLKTRKIEMFLSESLVDLYKKTQNDLSHHLKKIKQQNLKGGFGLADVKLDNLVEDKQGNLYFIDADKPEQVHWLTLLGQIYEDVEGKSPNTLFMDILEEKTEKVVRNNDISIKLINVGRMNRLLLPCTLRNISFNHETGRGNNEDKLKDLLLKTNQLMSGKSLTKLSIQPRY